MTDRLRHGLVASRQFKGYISIKFIDIITILASRHTFRSGYFVLNIYRFISFHKTSATRKLKTLNRNPAVVHCREKLNENVCNLIVFEARFIH